MIPKESAMIESHIKAMQALKGKSVEAGWFESAIYSPPNGGTGAGMPVAAIARILENGATIDHPGGTKYISDAIVKKNFVGTRFVHKNFQGEHKVTQAHKIVIPARPFMALAWSMFSQQRAALQKTIAKKLITGETTPAKALGLIGLALEGCIAKSIKNGNWTPNADSTARKKGFNKPLINSGHMLQLVSSKVI